MTHDVFISYAAEDKQVADSICSYLEKNTITCWMAPRDIAPGEIYASTLIHAIDSTQIVILVFSRYSDTSAHVRTEIQRAFNQGKFIIPFRIENIKPSDELQYFISGRQWLDALSLPLENHFSPLQKVIEKQLTISNLAKSGPPPQKPGTQDNSVSASASANRTDIQSVLRKIAGYPIHVITKIGIRLSQNKKVLFGVVGFVGGAIGALLGEIVPNMGTSVIVILTTGLWMGLAGMIISVGLFWATRIYNRSQPDPRDLFEKSVPSGFLAGLVSGAFAQTIYALPDISDIFLGLFFQAACWGLLGGILGWRLSRSNRNLGAGRAAIAGAIGGFVGGWCFIIIGEFIPEVLGRMLGIGILGAALGLSLILVEERYRPGFLEVHWAKNESSEFTLGSTPLHIGGGSEDDIFINGIPPCAMSLWMDHGKVKGTYHVTGDSKELHDGNPIKLGNVEMFVRIKLK